MPILKVVLLGEASVGKSSLVHRFSSGAFDPHSANTIGAAFISKEHESGQRNVRFEIWDTAGQERYKSLTPMYYRSAKVALVCFDMANAKQSFERAKYWVDQLRLSGPANIDIRIVGTKFDLIGEDGAHNDIGIATTETTNTETTCAAEIADATESTETTRNTRTTDATAITRSISNSEAIMQITEYCVNHNLCFVRTSAKLNQGVNEIFSSIVDSLDDGVFRESDSARPESQSDTILLRAQAKRSSCC